MTVPESIEPFTRTNPDISFTIFKKMIGRVVRKPITCFERFDLRVSRVLPSPQLLRKSDAPYSGRSDRHPQNPISIEEHLYALLRKDRFRPTRVRVFQNERFRPLEILGHPDLTVLSLRDLRDSFAYIGTGT